MARARNIKPAFFTDAELVECDFWVRLLFAGLWTLADRAGRLNDKPKQIKMDLFPADSVDIGAGLDELATHGFITRYVVDGVPLIQIANFAKHQNPHRDERASILPAAPDPEEHRANTVQTLCKPGGNRADSLVLIPDPGLLDENDAPAAPVREKYPEEFEKFWAAYPKGHGAKAVTYVRWKQVPVAERGAVLAGVAAWKESERWKRGVIVGAERWIREKRWRDEPPPHENGRAHINDSLLQPSDAVWDRLEQERQRKARA
jgi:hypothetical protein